jgi:hypothetical protein
MLNNFDYMGRFVADPELVTSTNGTSYTRFCLAQDEGKGRRPLHILTSLLTARPQRLFASFARRAV